MPIAAVHIAQSVQRGFDSLIAFIPNLVGCLIILFIGRGGAEPGVRTATDSSGRSLRL